MLPISQDKEKVYCIGLGGLAQAAKPTSAASHKKEDSMTSTISKLLASYENGKLSRRDLVQGLALLAAGSEAMSAAGFQGNSINHVSLYVSDLQKSSDF